MTENYITKLLSDCLQDCSSIAETHTGLKYIKKAITDISLRLHEPMQLAIVGRISSSKSTLVNAILGKAEVVRTGHEAETFNVSWLKYGSDDEPIKVHFKDGTHMEVDRSSWIEWASHSGEEKLKTKVSYIEVKASDEILKSINIIDTPGLDATSQIDSENTKQFLKQVNPDAVVLMFTKSLSENSLHLIEEFQKSDVTQPYSINPMNALGVLSKPDLNWNVLNDIDVVTASKDSISRTLARRDDVKRSLFRILPVSALMGVASFNITAKEYDFFKKLSVNNSIAELTRLFLSADSFVKANLSEGVSADDKKEFVLKYGLYGIYTCLVQIKKNPTISIKELANILRKKSGFEEFLDLLNSHFGDKSRILKAQKSIVSLLDACNRDLQDLNDIELHPIVESIRRRVSSIQDELHDTKEMELLNSIYEGIVSLEPTILNEIKAVCGENGDGITSRLSIPDDTPIEEMIRIAKERNLKCTGKYNSLKRISKQKALPYEIISKSYELIAKRLEEQLTEYRKALRTISIYNRYIYGRSKL